MISDFYIPRLRNNMKIALQRTHLGGQIVYRSLQPSKNAFGQVKISSKNILK